LAGRRSLGRLVAFGEGRTIVEDAGRQNKVTQQREGKQNSWYHQILSDLLVSCRSMAKQAEETCKAADVNETLCSKIVKERIA